MRLGVFSTGIRPDVGGSSDSYCTPEARNVSLCLHCLQEPLQFDPPLCEEITSSAPFLTASLLLPLTDIASGQLFIFYSREHPLYIVSLCVQNTWVCQSCLKAWLYLMSGSFVSLSSWSQTVFSCLKSSYEVVLRFYHCWNLRLRLYHCWAQNLCALSMGLWRDAAMSTCNFCFAAKLTQQAFYQLSPVKDFWSQILMLSKFQMKRMPGVTSLSDKVNALLQKGKSNFLVRYLQHHSVWLERRAFVGLDQSVKSLHTHWEPELPSLRQNKWKSCR